MDAPNLFFTLWNESVESERRKERERQKEIKNDKKKKKGRERGRGRKERKGKKTRCKIKILPTVGFRALRERAFPRGKVLI